MALGQIRSLSIHKPQLAEQTKIANFLSSIDQKLKSWHSKLNRPNSGKRLVAADVCVGEPNATLSNPSTDITRTHRRSFSFEREIQSLFESNLYSFTGLEFIKSEFTIKNNRIDTLAFDPESQAFVIIEYKRERNYSVIDQGVSYLNLMLDYKADFIVEYNENQSKQLKRQDVDWSQSRIIFVSPSFTDFQKQSTNFKDLGIELWEIKRYQGGIVSVNPLQKAKSAPSIKQVQRLTLKIFKNC